MPPSLLWPDLTNDNDDMVMATDICHVVQRRPRRYTYPLHPFPQSCDDVHCRPSWHPHLPMQKLRHRGAQQLAPSHTAGTGTFLPSLLFPLFPLFPEGSACPKSTRPLTTATPAQGGPNSGCRDLAELTKPSLGDTHRREFRIQLSSLCGTRLQKRAGGHPQKEPQVENKCKQINQNGHIL